MNTMKTINIMKKFTAGILIFLTLAACNTTSDGEFKPKSSFLVKNGAEVKGVVGASQLTSKATQSKKEKRGMSYLSPLSTSQLDKNETIDLAEQFSKTQLVQLTADDLSLKDYLHYVMGDLLGVSYILGEKIKTDTKSVTFNLQHNVSQRKLFKLSEELLTERGYLIRFEDEIFYIHREEETGSQGKVVYGYGKNVKNVPNTSFEIIQMVSLDFGMQPVLPLVMNSIANVKVTVDTLHRSYSIKGKRRAVIKALEFIAVMDQPGYRNREIGVYKTTYVSTEDIKLKLIDLLKQEGLTVSPGTQTDKAVSIVTLERTGTLIFFANLKSVLNRVEFWANKIDQPPSGSELQYFHYQPQFSRATDLGESLQLLIGSTPASGIGSNTTAATQNQKSDGKSKQNSSFSVSEPDMKLVVDKRANVLIFKTTGDKYKKLLPLIKRLDVMPKQVMLEVMIAEVTLTDEFKQGVEFAFNNGNYKFSTKGALGVEKFGGLSYMLTGTNGSVAINMFQTNSHVNILSRPSIVVRDGIEASITVGNDIPIVGATSQDPTNGQTTEIEYRKTGVELNVTPTINAQGVITLVIQQKISNQIEGGSTVSNSPSFFERTINTEVVAGDQQTVILGGLISENKTQAKTSVPFFSSIPILGHLFTAETDSGDKTELIVMVTPKIIESTGEWDKIISKFSNTTSSLKLNH